MYKHTQLLVSVDDDDDVIKRPLKQFSANPGLIRTYNFKAPRSLKG